jgi:hypothetical protein
MSISFAPAVSPVGVVELVTGRMLDIVGRLVGLTVGRNVGGAVVLWTDFAVIAVCGGRMGVGSSVAAVGKLVGKSDTVGIDVGKSVGIGVLAVDWEGIEVGSSLKAVGMSVAKSGTVGTDVGKSDGIGVIAMDWEGIEVGASVLAAIGFKVFGFGSEVG